MPLIGLLLSTGRRPQPARWGNAVAGATVKTVVPSGAAQMLTLDRAAARGLFRRKSSGIQIGRASVEECTALGIALHTTPGSTLAVR